jgi:YVTN family beta-propeller protein
MNVRYAQLRKRFLYALILASALLLASVPAVAGSRRLVTGKQITYPPLGSQQNVGSLPMNILLSPDGKYAVVSDMGFRQSLSALSAKTGALVSSVDYPNNLSFTNGLYYGLAFGSDGTLYAAQGANDSIDILNLSDKGILFETGSIATQAGDFPSGLAADTRGYLYVANNDPSDFSVPSSIAIYSLETLAEVGRYSFTSNFLGTPNFPLAVAVLGDGSKLYVTSERDGAVYVFNTSDPSNPTLTATIATGANPDGLLLDHSQSLLYVANAGSDTVSVVSTATDTVLSTVLLRPQQLHNLPGTTPTGLALSPNGSKLFVALGDLNAVAVLGVDGSGLTINGFVPAGWYPSGVAATGNALLVANAKGTTPTYPNPGYVQYQFNSNSDYDLNLIEGNVSFITSLTDRNLETWTKMVLANNDAAGPDHRLDAVSLRAGAIKHVIYIVKENRTYDQVLGDVPGGNGDPSLVLFGSSITPNQHALAQRFVLLDNYYSAGEASGDGWPWSTQSVANENVIKNLPYNYSGRGRNYDFEGQNNGYLVAGFPAKDPNGNTNSFYFPNGAPAVPDVTEAPGHHIWDAVRAAGLTYRNYGFFYSFGVTDGSGNVVMPDNFPAATGLQPAGRDLSGISDFDFRRYDNGYADSDAPTAYGCPYGLATYGKYNEPSRFSEWLRELTLMLQQDPTGNSVPNFMTVRFNHDHTQGLSSGNFTPSAEVADNDYAVGQLVQAISNSPIWRSTAIFIVEDDSQDGPDHVDAHRGTGYVISPWIKQSSIDHRFYNTDSVLKTMELILHVPSLTSYDGGAMPIMDWDTQPNNIAPYTAVPAAQEVVCEKTPTLDRISFSDPRRQLIIESNKMDFEHPDSAPSRRLNEIIWKSVKGVHSQPPAPRHSTAESTDSDD